MTDSCNDGYQASQFFTHDGGQVGNVTDSCKNVDNACMSLFDGTGNFNNTTNTRNYLPFSWDIESGDMAVVAFGDDSIDKKLQISYNISNKDYNITAMTENCTSIVSTDIISPNTSEVSSPTHMQLIFSADINLTVVMGSAVWTTPAKANLDLAYSNSCVRLEFWHAGISMNFLERNISLHLNMTSEVFDVTASSLNCTEGQTVNEKVDAEYVVQACPCTELLQYDTSPEENTLTQGDSLYIYLKASTAELVFSDIKALTISQTTSDSTVTQNPVADTIVGGPLQDFGKFRNYIFRCFGTRITSFECN